MLSALIRLGVVHICSYGINRAGESSIYVYDEEKISIQKGVGHFLNALVSLLPSISNYK